MLTIKDSGTGKRLVSFMKIEKKRLKILFVSSEEAPFAKAGGLGEVMFSLPRALSKLGHDARVMMPRYGIMDSAAHDLHIEHKELVVPTGPDSKVVCGVVRRNATEDPRSPVTTYFLENQEYFELRNHIYGYKDDRIRFAILSRGTLEFLDKSTAWTPDLIVCTDYMTGLLPNFLKTEYKDHPRLRSIATVFSIHNLSSQGPAQHHKFVSEMERDDGHSPIPDFFSNRMENINAMRRGIMYADVINTVSPRYAEEITTEEFGEGLEALLAERRNDLFGILNGIDYETIDPSTDQLISTPFSSGTLEKRAENKAALQKRFGLPQEANTFVAGIVSRITWQKGFSLLLPVIESFLRMTKSQLIVVGSGENEIQISTFFKQLEKKFSSQVRVHLQFDDILPRAVFAGADVVLIPSYFEPSGLTQMEAMRYGAIPVARRVGGLADTIENYSPATGRGTGFLFGEFDPMAFFTTLTYAFASWQHKNSWKKLQKRAMDKDFSWEQSAREYKKIFLRTLKIKKEQLLLNE